MWVDWVAFGAETKDGAHSTCGSMLSQGLRVLHFQLRESTSILKHIKFCFNVNRSWIKQLTWREKNESKGCPFCDMNIQGHQALAASYVQLHSRALCEKVNLITNQLLLTHPFFLVNTGPPSLGRFRIELLASLESKCFIHCPPSPPSSSPPPPHCEYLHGYGSHSRPEEIHTKTILKNAEETETSASKASMAFTLYRLREEMLWVWLHNIEKCVSWACLALGH